MTHYPLKGSTVTTSDLCTYIMPEWPDDRSVKEQATQKVAT